MNEKLKKLIDKYIDDLKNTLPPEILSKETEVLKNFQDWVTIYLEYTAL
jgi:hypothetical protein